MNVLIDPLVPYREATKAERQAVVSCLEDMGEHEVAHRINRCEHIPAGEQYDFVRDLSDVVTPAEADHHGIVDHHGVDPAQHVREVAQYLVAHLTRSFPGEQGEAQRRALLRQFETDLELALLDEFDATVLGWPSA